MFWGCFCAKGMGATSCIYGPMNGTMYVKIFNENLQQQQLPFLSKDTEESIFCPCMCYNREAKVGRYTGINITK